MSVINLTEARIRELPLGSGIWRDEQVKGLLVICHATTKTYAAQGDVRRNGRHIRTVRVKIDRVDRIGLREARNRARTIMSQIQSGVDPSAKPEETAITLKRVLEEHLSERPLRPSTEVNYRYAVDTYLIRFRGRAVADITRTDVRELFKELKEKRGTTAAGGARRDADFGARYGAAMDTAFHQVLSKAFERSMADEEPSDRLIEVLLKFRWPERLNGFLAFTAEGGAAAAAPAGLDPRIIARMEPAERAALIGLLGKYLAAETEAATHGALVQIN